MVRRFILFTRFGSGAILRPYVCCIPFYRAALPRPWARTTAFLRALVACILYVKELRSADCRFAVYLPRGKRAARVVFQNTTALLRLRPHRARAPAPPACWRAQPRRGGGAARTTLKATLAPYPIPSLPQWMHAFLTAHAISSQQTRLRGWIHLSATSSSVPRLAYTHATLAPSPCARYAHAGVARTCSKPLPALSLYSRRYRCRVAGRARQRLAKTRLQFHGRHGARHGLPTAFRG